METSEDLLSAWMDLTANIRGNRILSELSLNEIMLLRLLHREGGEDGLTATVMTERLRLLKSQTHKVLKDLEAKGFIFRRRDRRDTRTVRIVITDEGAQVYLREHSRVMELVDKVVDSLGIESAQQLTRLMISAVSAAEAVREEK